MTENTALIWIRDMRARGVRLTVANHRLFLKHPGDSRKLSDAELLTLRNYKAQIIEALE